MPTVEVEYSAKVRKWGQPPFLLTSAEKEALERTEAKSIPYGRDRWIDKTVKKYGIEQVLKGVGRPRNGG